MTPLEAPAASGLTAARLRYVLVRLARALRRESRSTLTASQVSALAALEESGPMRISTLAGLEATDPSVATRVVAGLEGLGLVARRDDPDDRRACLVELSREGRRVLSALWDERAHELDERLAGLTADERRAVEAALPALEKIARDE